MQNKYISGAHRLRPSIEIIAIILPFFVVRIKFILTANDLQLFCLASCPSGGERGRAEISVCSMAASQFCHQ